MPQHKAVVVESAAHPASPELTFKEAAGKDRSVWGGRGDCRCGIRTPRSCPVGAAVQPSAKALPAAAPCPVSATLERVADSAVLVNQTDGQHPIHPSTIPLSPPPRRAGAQPNTAAPSTFSRIQHCGTSPWTTLFSAAKWVVPLPALLVRSDPMSQPRLSTK